MLLVLEGDSQEDLMNQAESIYPFFENQGALNVYIPNNADMANDWWSARRSIGELVKQQSIYKEEDTVVPRSKLPELLRVVKDTDVTLDLDPYVTVMQAMEIFILIF